MTEAQAKIERPAATDRAPPAPPAAMVIFGASGDLTKRLLVPSLCHLRRGGLLGDRFALVGVGRAAMTDERFRAIVGDSVASARRRPYGARMGVGSLSAAIIYRAISPIPRLTSVSPPF